VNVALGMTNYKRYCSSYFLARIILIAIVLFHPACTSQKYVSSINYAFKSGDGRPDYSNLDYWAAYPGKINASNQVPSGLKDAEKDSLADVFFVYPTSYTDPAMPMGWNAAIDDPALNRQTDEKAMYYQASVFNKHCRIFAPRYRQANLQAFYTPDKALGLAALDTAYTDVREAFLYYLRHWNHGRPIIIASHSQGTWHAGKLLREFFDGKPLESQLVCAYLIGLPVFTNYFTALSPCNNASATGCFVSWRTFQEGYTAPFVAQEQLRAYVINPLTWTMDTALAPAVLNKGGILRNFNKVIPGLVHARIHGNILWVNKPKFFGSIFLRIKNYHIADYNLFYDNIRLNAGTRIAAFLQPANPPR